MTRIKEMVKVFGRIGLLSFGGPAAQIALMHRELVETRPWLTEAQFLRALSLCMLLPGPEAMQLATYAGWRLRGVMGGLIAGGLFVLPGALVIALLALLYTRFGAFAPVQAVFVGIQATVVVIVLAALKKLLAKVAQGPVALALAAGAFVAIYVLGTTFPLVIAAAALIGARALPRPDTTEASPPALHGLGRIVALGMVIWFAPIMLAAALNAEFLYETGVYFAKLALVTFGGAYALLAYMAQTVVQDMGWVSTAQMIDALGLAETTPGPLILVTQMIAMLAGNTIGGWPLALAAGGMALWVTFVPSFIFIFAGAPLIDWLAGQARLQAALNGITAAVVGVIASLSLWFTFNVLFAQVHDTAFGLWPTVTSLQPVPALLVLVAAACVFWRGWGLLPVLALNAGLGLLFFSIAAG